MTSTNLLKSKVQSSLTNLGNAIDAKLQTATSSCDVYSTISVQRFEQCIVPRFF